MRRGLKCEYPQRGTPPAPTTQPSGPSVVELELLHNFTISTANTLSTDPTVRNLWRVNVPQIGFSVSYILNSILSLSALHMARYNPDRKDFFLTKATEYHTASLKEALPLIPKIAADNCTHLFLFSVLTLFISLASPIKDDDILLIGNGVIPEWLYLIRGVWTLIKTEQQAVRSSAISLIFRSTQPTMRFWRTHTPDDHEMLRELENGIMRRTVEDKTKQETLRMALDPLKRSYTFFGAGKFSDEDKVRGFNSWLFAISDGYLKLLKEMDYEALCVLAYFAVLLREIERFWWIQGWSVHLIRRIYHVLDDEHRLCIRWAIEEIGWVPESKSK